MKKNRLHRGFSLLEKYGDNTIADCCDLIFFEVSTYFYVTLFSSVSFLFAVEKRQRKKKIIRNDRGNSCSKAYPLFSSQRNRVFSTPLCPFLYLRILFLLSSSARNRFTLESLYENRVINTYV